MRNSVPAVVSNRKVNEGNVGSWANDEMGPLAKELRAFANQRYQAQFALTTAATGTFATIWASDAMPDNSVWEVDVYVVGRASSGGAARARYKLAGLFFREVASVATQEGATLALVTLESVAGFDAQLTVSANTVLCQVRDDGVRTMDWMALVHVREA